MHYLKDVVYFVAAFLEAKYRRREVLFSFNGARVSSSEDLLRLLRSGLPKGCGRENLNALMSLLDDALLSCPNSKLQFIMVGFLASLLSREDYLDRSALLWCRFRKDYDLPPSSDVTHSLSMDSEMGKPHLQKSRFSITAPQSPHTASKAPQYFFDDGVFSAFEFRNPGDSDISSSSNELCLDLPMQCDVQLIANQLRWNSYTKTRIVVFTALKSDDFSLPMLHELRKQKVKLLFVQESVGKRVKTLLWNKHIYCIERVGHKQCEYLIDHLKLPIFQNAPQFLVFCDKAMEKQFPKISLRFVYNCGSLSVAIRSKRIQQQYFNAPDISMKPHTCLLYRDIAGLHVHSTKHACCVPSVLQKVESLLFVEAMILLCHINEWDEVDADLSFAQEVSISAVAESVSPKVLDSIEILMRFLGCEG